MGNFLSKNLRFLRNKAGYTQDDFDKIGIKKGTYSNYEIGKTEPKIDTLIDLSKFLGVSLHELLLVDIEFTSDKTDHKHFEKPIVASPLLLEPSTNSIEPMLNIPIIDIEAAAGAGTFNANYLDVLGYLTIPSNTLQKKNAVYYALRSRGDSMYPTIFDKDYLIARHLDKSEFEVLRDEYVYIVVDKDGKSYVKRIKDRLSRGFVVCMSDNLDKRTYPNFTLEEKEIANLFYVELKLSAHLPNINAGYFDRLKALEDRVDDIEGGLKRIR